MWISGDTVLYDAVREVPSRLEVGTAVHLGNPPGDRALRYTMTGLETVQAVRAAPAAHGDPAALRGLEALHGGSRRDRARLRRGTRHRGALWWLPLGVGAEIAV